MSILDTLIFGYRTIRGASGDLASRTILRFVGASVTDDPASGATIVTVPSPASISTATPQAIATTGTAGASGAISDAGHVHAIGEAVLRSLGSALTASLPVNGQKVTGLGTPSASTDAATKGYVDTAATSAANLQAAITAVGGNDIAFGASRLTDVGNPVSAYDATNKSYVDGVFAGRDWKQSVRLATAAALPSCIYANTTAGANATLTASANGALTVDGVAVAVNDRVLVKDQAAGLQNGIYFVVATGGASATWQLQRDTDANSSTTLTTGAACFVSAGTANAGTAYFLDTADPITIGTTALVWAQLPDATVAGTGLSRSGNTLSVAYGTTAGTAAQGDDSRITGAVQTVTASSDRVISVTSSGTTRTLASTAGTMIHRGAYSNSAPYKDGDVVTSGGAAYVYVYGSVTIGNAPPNATYWEALGGSTSWPGTSSQLTGGDGSAVSLGNNLALSGSTLAVSTIANTLNPWFAAAEAAIVAKLGLSAGTYAVAADDHYSAAGVLGWTNLTVSAAGIGGQVTLPVSTVTTPAMTATNMSKTSTAYGFGFRVQYNPGAGYEAYVGVAKSDYSEYVLGMISNASGKSIKGVIAAGGSNVATAASTVLPDANWHTVLVVFKYAGGSSNVVSLSVDGETWIDSATTSKNPSGLQGLMHVSPSGGTALVDKSIFVATV